MGFASDKIVDCLPDSAKLNRSSKSRGGNLKVNKINYVVGFILFFVGLAFSAHAQDAALVFTPGKLKLPAEETQLNFQSGLEIQIDATKDFWLNGQDFRNLMDTDYPWVKTRITPWLEKLNRVHVVENQSTLDFTFYLDQVVHVEWVPEDKRVYGQLYGYELPRVFRYQLSQTGDSFVLKRIVKSLLEDKASLLIEMPIVSDSVYLRNLVWNRAKGELSVEAGVVGDIISLVAVSNLTSDEKKFQIQYWDSFVDNLKGIIFLGSHF